MFLRFQDLHKWKLYVEHLWNWALEANEETTISFQTETGKNMLHSQYKISYSVNKCHISPKCHLVFEWHIYLQRMKFLSFVSLLVMFLDQWKRFSRHFNLISIKNGFCFSLKGLTNTKWIWLVEKWRKNHRVTKIREKKLTAHAQFLKFFEWIKQNS